MARRYVLLPDYIHSRVDGQRHFIDARKLASLYHLDINAPDVTVVHETDRGTYRPCEDDVMLPPLYSGRYYHARDAYPCARA